MTVTVTVKPIVSVNPFRCRVWSLHHRLETNINEETCRTEIQSVQKQGQLVPVLGRPVGGDPDCDIEIIYGARRLFVARHINVPLLVELRDVSDRDGIVAMEIENRHRKDVCAYERGLSYARWLRAGLFNSQEDLGRAVEVSAAQMSRLLKLARLPSVVVAAFEKVDDICEGWGLELTAALENPEQRTHLIETARELARAPRRSPAREVYRELLASSVRGRKPKVLSRDRIIKGHNGDPLFRIRQRSTSIAIILPTQRTSARCLEEIQTAVTRIMDSRVPEERPLVVRRDDVRVYEKTAMSVAGSATNS